MTGRWCGLEDGAAKLSHERFRFELEKGAKRSALAYLDTRRFGRVLSAREDIEAWTELGPDPIADGIDVARLHDEFQARRTTAKVALLDQTLLAGIGNIHATEALWLARIDPRSPTRAFTKADLRALARGIDTTLRRGLAQQKGEVPAYVNQGAENRFHIYDRKGPCPRCEHPLRKITLGGRSTTFCPSCQKRLSAPRRKPSKRTG
jgi:formamidopyrimidine-DNA glycosylase